MPGTRTQMVRVFLVFTNIWQEDVAKILKVPGATKSFEDINILIKAILKFCTANKLFKYFRKRYSDQQLKILNKLVKTRGKLRSLQSLIAFLKAAIFQRVVLEWIHARFDKSRARHKPNNLLHFLVKLKVRLKTCLFGLNFRSDLATRSFSTL